MLGLKAATIRMMMLPPVLHGMNSLINRAPVVFTVHRRANPAKGILGHDTETIKRFLDFLQEHRYRVLTVDQIIEELAQGNSGALTNTVAFTFDGGFADQAQLVRDAFLPFGFPATMFVATDFIDGKDWLWDTKIKWICFNAVNASVRILIYGKTIDLQLHDKENRHKSDKVLRNVLKYLPPAKLNATLNILAEQAGVTIPVVPPEEHRPISWNEARELERHGINFGSHSVSHYVFSSLNWQEAEYQIEISAQRIRAELEKPSEIFCYPVGDRRDFTGREMLLLPKHGYKAAVTMNPGVFEIKNHREHKNIERFEYNRIALPDNLQDFVQYATWIERTKDTLRRLNPLLLINQRYGTKRGAYNLFRHWLSYWHGEYDHLKNVDWRNVKRLVFICKGNVCRSPFAEAVSHQLGLPAVSYGLNTTQGTFVNSIASKIALQLGVDMTRHESRKLKPDELKEGDLVIGMEPEHCAPSQFADAKPRLQYTLIGLINPVNKTPYLHDPFGLGDNYFHHCFSYIQSTVHVIRARMCV